MTIFNNPKTGEHFTYAAVPALVGVSCAVMGMAINTRSFFQGMRLFALPTAMPVAAGLGLWINGEVHQNKEQSETALSPLAKGALMGGAAWVVLNGPLFGLSQLYAEKVAPLAAGLNGVLAGSLVLGSATAATLLSLPETLEGRHAS